MSGTTEQTAESQSYPEYMKRGQVGSTAWMTEFKQGHIYPSIISGEKKYKLCVCGWFQVWWQEDQEILV